FKEIMSEIEPLHLLDHQVDHFHRCHQNLLAYPGYIDNSETGAGKTVVAMALAITLKLDLFVVCPMIVIPTWTDTAARYGVGIVEVINFESLRSTYGHQPQHGYVYRSDAENEETTFVVTEKFIDLLKSKNILLVIDELHHVKNTC